MQRASHKFSYLFLLTISGAVFSDTGAGTGSYNPPNMSSMSNSMSNLTQYLKNLGEYFGYDLTQYCQSGGSCSGSGESGSSSGGGAGGFSNTLLNVNGTYKLQLNLFNSYLGALIGGGTPNSDNSHAVIPPSAPGSSVINTLAGQTFSTPPYSTPSTQDVSVVNGVDQPTYQSDPVSQFLLNLLSTPGVSYCWQTTDGPASNSGSCPILFREKVMSQVIGSLQPAKTVFTSSNNQALVPQLNSDTLLSPLLYTTNNAGSENSTSSSPPDTNSSTGGLSASTQAQQASNFIRYVSGSVTPMVLPSYGAYDRLVALAMNYSKQTAPEDQAKAQTVLLGYLTKIRTYAAQSSVAMGNLYYIMSKRLPQNPVGGSGGASSEALNEFLMASWRLYNPNQSGDGGKQWLTAINHASNATVQKEIAILLAEINYQLYLSRQQQERLLLTESVMLLQNLKISEPNGDLGSGKSMLPGSAVPGG